MPACRTIGLSCVMQFWLAERRDRSWVWVSSQVRSLSISVYPCFQGADSDVARVALIGCIGWTSRGGEALYMGVRLSAWIGPSMYFGFPWCGYFIDFSCPWSWDMLFQHFLFEKKVNAPTSASLGCTQSILLIITMHHFNTCTIMF